VAGLLHDRRAARLRVSRLLPEDAREYRGAQYAWWGATAYLVLVTVRSLVHLVAADGGAQTIATVDTSVDGGDNIVAMFGQWGAMQLLLAAVLWVLLLRYRGLTPLVLLVFLVEPFLRALSGRLKPLETVGSAPGEVFNWVVVPLLAVLLIASLRTND
jgi:hypothetical protein